MKIKLIEKRKPGTKTGPGKFYANPVNVGCKTLKDIAGRSSLTRGDIENVLENKRTAETLFRVPAGGIVFLSKLFVQVTFDRTLWRLYKLFFHYFNI